MTNLFLFVFAFFQYFSKSSQNHQSVKHLHDLQISIFGPNCGWKNSIFGSKFLVLTKISIFLTKFRVRILSIIDQNLDCWPKFQSLFANSFSIKKWTSKSFKKYNFIKNYFFPDPIVMESQQQLTKAKQQRRNLENMEGELDAVF